ncbi:MAG: hypothetical protein DMF84_26000 [Acidobacteria bacterium]|nr:MAG: hypothetical protein DMF84_26000 [Acidobacteriota bacterium]
MKGRVLPIVAVLGWSVPAFAQPAPETSASRDRLQMACAPMSLPAAPNQALRVLGGYQRGRLLFGPDEALIVNAGANQGVRQGQEYYVRRVVHDRFTRWTLGYQPISIHTAGRVRIVDVQPDVSVAAVTQACDGVMYGDYLEPFVDPVLPPGASVIGQPDFEHSARIALGDERRQTGAPGSLMVLDQGSDAGLRAGQTLTIYRWSGQPTPMMAYYGPTLRGRGPSVRVGTARVLSVQPRTALIRIESSREAVYVGDFAAVHRPAP